MKKVMFWALAFALFLPALAESRCGGGGRGLFRGGSTGFRGILSRIRERRMARVEARTVRREARAGGSYQGAAFYYRSSGGCAECSMAPAETEVPLRYAPPLPAPEPARGSLGASDTVLTPDRPSADPATWCWSGDEGRVSW